MIDYAEIVNAMQKGVAEAFADNPALLNEPGLSLACKIDPFYYLAIYPGFRDFFVKRCGLAPAKVEEALIKTGMLITRGSDRSPSLRLKVQWAYRPGLERRGELEAAFINASFIDHALALYAKASEPSVSELRLSAGERVRVERFLAGKTLPLDMAYTT
jgi:hypothetical protein